MDARLVVFNNQRELKTKTMNKLEKKIDKIEQLLIEVKELAQDKKKLEKKPKAKKVKEPEKGKWYTSGSVIVCCSKYSDGLMYGYGMGSFSWSSIDASHWGTKISTWKLAKDSDVEKMLIKEAKKRGFKEMVKFKTVLSGMEERMYMLIKRDNQPHYEYKGNCLRIWGYTIFNNGKWAKIIEDKLELNGKEVKIEKGRGVMEIGCKWVSIKDVESIVSLSESNGITSITHPDLGDIKVSDLKNLLKN